MDHCRKRSLTVDVIKELKLTQMKIYKGNCTLKNVVTAEYLYRELKTNKL